jgi:drug/metabolite transporter (DMT)-like permease
MTRDWRLWAALGTVYLVWGSTYLAIRVMVETIPPLLGTGVRFLAAGALLYAWLYARGGSERVRATRPELGGAATVGALVLIGGIGLVTVAEQHVASSLAALIIASVPLWVVILRKAGRERIERGTLAGVGLGFAGVALIAVPEGGSGGPVTWAVLLLLLAAVTTAIGSYLSPRLPQPADTLASTALQMLSSGVALVTAGVVLGEGGDVELAEASDESVAAFAYLTLIGSLAAYSAFVWLLANAPVSTVSTYAYVNPVVALVLGWAVLGEELSTLTAVGAAGVVVSVALVVGREEPRPAAQPEPEPARSGVR